VNPNLPFPGQALHTRPSLRSFGSWAGWLELEQAAVATFEAEGLAEAVPASRLDVTEGTGTAGLWPHRHITRRTRTVCYDHIRL